MIELEQNLEFRAARVARVSFPRRTIELVVMPYESETMVEHRGRMVREVISRGAFDGIQARPRRVAVNRDHDQTRLVGRAVAFHPERAEGLVAECRIAQTDLGNETLQLAHEELLDASAGFAPYPGGEVWEVADRRRITKAWLGHIAMTPDPAYPDARVLAVRSVPESPSAGLAAGTPNLDRVRAWKLEAAYERMNRG